MMQENNNGNYAPHYKNTDAAFVLHIVYFQPGAWGGCRVSVTLASGLMQF